MGRRLCWLGVFLLLGCSGSDDDAGAPPEMPASVTVGALNAGVGGYVGGVFVWTDYAYDDRGANRDGVDGDSGTDGGDARYPETLAVNNAADLIQLQIRLDGGDMTIRAVLETLVDPDIPVLAVAFDTDGDPNSGAAELPGGGWAADGPLGLDSLIEISSAGARWWRYDRGEWSVGEPFEATVDPDDNMLETTVAAEELPGRERGDRWRTVAAVGIATAAGNWLEGEADIFDLAFVGNEPFVRWQNNRQADILAGALDSDLAVAELDFAMMEDGATTISSGFSPGFHTLLYASELKLAEGIAYDENASPIFLGPYQPYLVYVPEEMPDPTPLSLFLHGSDQNHLGAVFQQPGDFYIGTGRALSEDPHLIATLGFAGDGFDFPPHMLQVYPLARGARLGYRGIAHQDALDVVADAKRRFNVDPDRIILQGASMGGIGTYRLGSLQPDKWSVALPLIGYQSPSLLPLSVNLRNLPVRQINGAADPLIAVEPAEASAKRLDELGYDYRFWLLKDRGHEAGGFVYDCVFEGAVDFVRNNHPAVVRFAVDSSLDEVDEETGLDLRFDSAYWVSAIRAREPGALADVSAVSFALPLYDETVRRIDRVVISGGPGADTGATLCGPDASVATGDEWRERAVEVLRGDPVPARNEIDATLDNVASLTFDLAGAGIDVTSAATVLVTTDGASAVTLTGLRRGQRVVRGDESAQADDSGSVAIEVDGPGTTLLEIRP